MPNPNDSINPYASPATHSRRKAGMVRTFEVGSEEINTLVVEASLLRGIRTHVIDAAGKSGPEHQGPCRFTVGNHERHEVQIEIDEWGRAYAYLDGTLLEANLFEPHHKVVTSLVIGLVVVVLALVFGFVFFWI